MEVGCGDGVSFYFEDIAVVVLILGGYAIEKFPHSREGVGLIVGDVYLLFFVYLEGEL